jgi:hypothetical protein
MADPRGYRDSKSGRFARRPVPDVDAESWFDLMGDDIPFEDVSGDGVPGAIDQARNAPSADPLAGPGPSYGSSLLRARRPELVSLDEEARTRYGVQGALTRDAARLQGLTGVLGYALGVESAPQHDEPMATAGTSKPNAISRNDSSHILETGHKTANTKRNAQARSGVNERG